MKLETKHSIPKEYAQIIETELHQMREAMSQGNDSRFASLYTPFDLEHIEQVKAIVQEMQGHMPHAIIVIGVGGSNLGTRAVAQAMYGVLYNEAAVRPKLYFVDTVDPDYTAQVLNHCEELLKYGDNVILNVVSKSGTTVEVLANFQLFYDMLKQHRPDSFHEYVVVTTDDGSPLETIARSEDLTILPISPLVGGRYSVFSGVGLFPLAMLNIDVEQLLEGARSMIESSFEQGLESIPSQTAALIYKAYKSGKPIHDLFVFAKELSEVGAWYRQLVAESLGKGGEGITPTTSVGSVDLHSVAQLYLGGPNDKVTTFVRVNHFDNLLIVPKTAFSQLAPKLTNKSYQDLMDAIVDGTQQTYAAHDRTFCSLSLEHIDAYELGELLQMQMMQVMLLGKLLGVDPFDQPDVEDYKSRTRTILEQ